MNDERPTGDANLDREDMTSRFVLNLTIAPREHYIDLTTPRHRAGWAAYMAARSVFRP